MVAGGIEPLRRAAPAAVVPHFLRAPGTEVLQQPFACMSTFRDWPKARRPSRPRTNSYGAAAAPPGPRRRRRRRRRSGGRPTPTIAPGLSCWWKCCSWWPAGFPNASSSSVPTAPTAAKALSLTLSQPCKPDTVSGQRRLQACGLPASVVTF